ncbi:MAG: hypothetical protein ABSF99_07690 [Anaerolineales bacterium]
MSLRAAFHRPDVLRDGEAISKSARRLLQSLRSFARVPAHTCTCGTGAGSAGNDTGYEGIGSPSRLYPKGEGHSRKMRGTGGTMKNGSHLYLR